MKVSPKLVPANPDVFIGSDKEKSLASLIQNQLSRETTSIKIAEPRELTGIENHYLRKISDFCVHHKFSVDTEVACMQMFHRVLEFRQQKHLHDQKSAKLAQMLQKEDYLVCM